jgi:probable phosphoglycerate mutase
MHLIRHGQSTWNLDHRVQGAQREPPLTELGRQQAAAAAVTVNSRAPGRIGLLLTSDQTRAVQTAEIVSSAIGVQPMPTPLLREQSWGALEGLTTTQALAALTDVDITDPDFRWAGGGESSNDVRSRIALLLGSPTITDLPAAAEMVLVSHGDTLRVLLAQLLGEDPADAPWRQFENGSVTTVQVSSEPRSAIRWRLADGPAVDTALGGAPVGRVSR